MSQNGFCWYCASVLTPFEFGRQDTCRKCGRDTRACKACNHFDSSAYNECREPQSDRVVDKERSNFCDYFKFNTEPPKLTQANTASAARAAAEAVFKKK